MPELAKRAALHRNTIAQHELGILTNVSVQAAKRIADVLGVAIEALFFDTNTVVTVNTEPALETLTAKRGNP